MPCLRSLGDLSLRLRQRKALSLVCAMRAHREVGLMLGELGGRKMGLVALDLSTILVYCYAYDGGY